MSNPTPTVKMVLARPGEVQWRPPRQPHSVQQPPMPPQKMDLSTLMAKLGYRVLIPRLAKVGNFASAWLPALTTYYGSLSPGADTAYYYESEAHVFEVIQRQILSSDHPMMFIYGHSVNAYQVVTNDGAALVVIPLFNEAHHFIVWVSGDIWVWVTFFWPASEEIMLEIVKSLA